MLVSGSMGVSIIPFICVKHATNDAVGTSVVFLMTFPDGVNVNITIISMVFMVFSVG